MEEAVEADILRNFLLVQADKHGHQLLASLPQIATAINPSLQPDKYSGRPIVKSEVDTDSSTSSNDENTPTRQEYLPLHQQQHHSHQQHHSRPLVFPHHLLPEAQQRQLHLLQQHMRSSRGGGGGGIAASSGSGGHHLEDMTLVTLSRRLASNEVSVIQKLGRPPQLLPDVGRPSAAVASSTGPAANSERFLSAAAQSPSSLSGSTAVDVKPEMADLEESIPVHVLKMRPSSGQLVGGSGGDGGQVEEGGQEQVGIRPLPKLMPIERRERVVNRVESGGNPLCEVCGERAGKHSYYGGQVCPSCRAFFRRSVQSRVHINFKCINRSQSCQITLLTRKNCQFCRYQKCIDSGMRPSWILSDEERKRRFHGRNRDKDRSKEQIVENEYTDLICPALSYSPSPSPSSQLSIEDRMRVIQYGEVMRRCCTARHDDLDPVLVSSLVQTAHQGTAHLTRQTAERLSSIIDNRTRVCFTLFQEFQSLSRADQAAVVHHNLPLIHRLRQALCLATHTLSWRSMVALLIGEDKIEEAEKYLPCDLSTHSNNTKPGKFEYRCLSSLPWFSQCKDTASHSQLINKIAQVVDPSDTVSLVLIILILAFNSDFLELENREQVESIQVRFVLLLQQHLSGPPTSPPSPSLVDREASCQSPHQPGCSLLQLLMLPSLLRQVAELTTERLLI